jgi:hypothetical protein
MCRCVDVLSEREKGVNVSDEEEMWDVSESRRV